MGERKRAEQCVWLLWGREGRDCRGAPIASEGDVEGPQWGSLSGTAWWAGGAPQGRVPTGHKGWMEAPPGLEGGLGPPLQGAPVSTQARPWAGEGPDTLTLRWSARRPRAASPETSALRGPRSPEQGRKQDAYQERLFLFSSTDPLAWLWGEPILWGLPRPGCCCPQPWLWLFQGPPIPPSALPRLLLLGWSRNVAETQGCHT